jgi:hypothetical protein
VTVPANVLAALWTLAVLSATCPLHERHVQQMAMGFDQEKTTHHFRLAPDGGTIQVEVNDPADADQKAHVVAHLQRITDQFASGDFTAPLRTHGEEPPGVPALRRLKDRIRYAFEPTERGGRVVLRTHDPDALAVIHRFLRYQIREHHTGDPVG